MKSIEEAEYQKRITQESIESYEVNRYGKKEQIIKEVYKFFDIPMDATIWMPTNNFNQLLERLTISVVLASHDKDINGEILTPTPKRFEDIMNETLANEIKLCEEVDRPDMQPHITPICDTLYYKYDYGDNWMAKITASSGVDDLLENERLTQEVTAIFNNKSNGGFFC